MNKFQNSKEFGEVVKHLNNKSFDKALKIINSIVHKYQDDQIILKMFASIYFNKLEWEKAITYYKKILIFGTTLLLKRRIVIVGKPNC